MACKYHQTTAAINTCKKCGQELCDACVIPFKGVHLCKDCLADEMKAHPHASHHMAPPPHPAPPPLPPRHHGSCHGYVGCEPKKKRISRFLLLCCSMLPGANYMFMGLIKRGLFVMSSFFFTIFLMSLFGHSNSVEVLLAFTCGMIFITSFFDGFTIRRRIISGENVEDSAKEITDFISRHKAKFVIGAIGLTIIGVFSYVVDMLRVYGFRSFSAVTRAIPEIYTYYGGGHNAYTYVGFNIFSLIPCILIFLCIFFMVKHMASRTRRAKYDSRRIDDRNEHHHHDDINE